MGAKMLKYYELVSAKAGMRGKMRLAMKTGISSARAGAADDSPEALSKFYAAAKELIGPSAPRL